MKNQTKRGQRMLGTAVAVVLSISLLPMTAVAADNYSAMALKTDGTLRDLAYQNMLSDVTQNSAFSDTEGHWANTYVSKAAANGLVSGTGDGKFEPENAVTNAEWAQMIVNLMGYTAESVREEGYWWSGTLSAVLENGAFKDTVIESGSRGTTLVSPLAGAANNQISRFDMAMVIYNIGTQQGWGEAATDSISSSISDWSNVPNAYRTAVAYSYANGVITGVDDKGTFDGNASMTRAAAATVLCRLLDAKTEGVYPAPSPMTNDKPNEPEPEGQDRASLAIEEYYKAMEELKAGGLTWEEIDRKDFWLDFPGNNLRKRLEMFGDGDKYLFDSREEAEGAMVQVTVPVWKLNASTGEKTSSTCSFSIHHALKDRIVAVFTDIYNDPEQFPIYAIGGYQWRGDSATGEHNTGTAVDINPNENYQIFADGRIGAGALWEPGENPFSIPENGSVVRIFEGHGFTWGGTAWSSNSDYMHFSYMGR